MVGPIGGGPGAGGLVPPGRAPRPPQRVIFKLDDGIVVPANVPLARGLERVGVPWGRVKLQFPRITVAPLFTDQRKLDQLIARARRITPGYRPPRFQNYYAVTGPRTVDVEKLWRALSGPPIQRSYVESEVSLPGDVDPEDDEAFASQGYLQCGKGIGAVHAWSFAGGDGAGVSFVDIEQGWDLTHVELSEVTKTNDFGVDGGTEDQARHGNACLGIVLAADNEDGLVGAAPHVSNPRVQSIFFNEAPTLDRPRALLSALSELDPGDVLLLELQVRNGPNGKRVPVELDQDVYDAIVLGIAGGVTIVEAAANGEQNLADVTDSAGLHILDRNRPDRPDSGAILVAASNVDTNTPTLARFATSNFGNRIDCYAWGEDIRTCALGSPSRYELAFGETSGASAIVAGAAICLQGVVKALRSTPLSPALMRQILSTKEFGTASHDPPKDQIGVMPDLCKIIDGAIDDVYVRDNESDTGAPHTGAVSSSPDLAVLTHASDNPFGTATSGQVQTATEHLVYVRVRNRGYADAKNVLATVYWSPPAALVTPAHWNKIGSTVIPSVPKGDNPIVAPAISWPAADVPATGHYCFVCVIGTVTDPAPTLVELANWDAFVEMIRRQNNVTWRNFNVVSRQAGDGRPFMLPFFFAGAPDRAVPMSLEVEARLGEGAEVGISMASRDLSRLRPPLRRPLLLRPFPEGPLGLRLSPMRRSVVGRLRLPEAARLPLALRVTLPDPHPEDRRLPEVAVIQRFEGTEVGRITWRFEP